MGVSLTRKRINSLLLLSLSCTFTSRGSGQIVFVAGQNCVDTSDTAPIGGYFGTLTECNVQALCSGYLLFSTLDITVYSGLACPNHFVQNTSKGGWNAVDAINGVGSAIDLYNLLPRGSAFAQEACGGPPISFATDNSTVCDAQPPGWEPPIVVPLPPGGGGGGGDGGGPGPVSCYYGFMGNIWCNV